MEQLVPTRLGISIYSDILDKTTPLLDKVIIPRDSRYPEGFLMMPPHCMAVNATVYHCSAVIFHR